MPELSNSSIHVLRDLIRRVDNIRGDGVSNTPNGITISWPPTANGTPDPDEQWFILRITSAATGGAMYKARRQVPKRITQMAGQDPSSDLDLSAILDDRMSEDDSAFWNLGEAATGTHGLAVDGSVYVLGKAMMFKTNFTPELPVFAANVGGALPPGGIQYQPLQRMDPLNTPGWYWTRLH